MLSFEELVCKCSERSHSVSFSHSTGGMEGERDPLADIRAQCSHTHNVGHALLFALLCQKLAAPEDKDVSRNRNRN